MGDKGVERGLRKQRGGPMKPISATRLLAGFLFEGLLGLRNRGRPDFSPKSNLNPIRVLTESVGSLIGLRFLVPGDSVRTILPSVHGDHPSSRPGRPQRPRLAHVSRHLGHNWGQQWRAPIHFERCLAAIISCTFFFARCLSVPFFTAHRAVHPLALLRKYYY